MAGNEPRSSRGTGLNSNRQAYSIHEPEPIRLQRDIETITQKLEFERREQLLLDDQIRVLEDEIKEVKQKHNDFTSNKTTENKLISQFSVLERKLEIAYNQVSDVQAQNRTIRDSIDSLRKERVNYKNMIDSLSTDIHSFSSQAQVKNQESRKGETVDEKHKRHINLLRSKSANERSRFNEKVSQLTSVLKDDRDAREETHKKIEESLNQQFKKGNDVVEGTKILKVMLTGWKKVISIQKVKDRKKSLDNYFKHIKALESAFVQMSEATGISSIEEIVTTFIKSEEQKYTVSAYINELTAEIDQIEENNRKTSKTIERCKDITSSGEKRVKDIMEDLYSKYERVLKKKETRQMNLNDLKETLNKLMDPIKRMIEVSQDMNISSSIQTLDISDFSEANMLKFLGQIEGYVNKAQIYTAYKNKEKNPATKALLLDSLPEKQQTKDMCLKDLLDIKDEIEDPELEDSKVPLKLPYLRERAKKLFTRRGIEPNSQSMSFRRDTRSVTPQ